MISQATRSRDDSFLGDLLDRARRAFSRWDELGRLDAQQFEAVARDLNLSPAELNALAVTPPSALESLGKRLAYIGISENTLAASSYDVLRDMQRVCSLCTFKARCAADLRRGRCAAPTYCPNESTLRALSAEANKQPTAQIPAFHAD
ncbi:MAG TPA: hypothetical protein VKR55_03135 [Bradyrhizobium sp.]|uniref:hypothetical protein n=1 Tax=Bradyrhizobium sp. TaxID=376 RepID=UPI002BE1F977|nr:hypothetical protein [Bradyrhizobium sp.]HLZ01127.1 hypothetical protein [Bradyrhizobium sp.]